MALLFLPLYAFFSIENNKRWKYIAGIFCGSLLISHFYTSVIFFIFLGIFYLLRVLIYKRFSKHHLDAILIGVLSSLIFWIPSLVINWSDFKEGARAGGVELAFPLMEKIAGSLTFSIFFFLSLALFIFLYIKRKLCFK